MTVIHSNRSRRCGSLPSALLCCISLLAYTFSASAAETSGNPSLREALRLYEEFEYEQSLRLIERAVEWPSNTREEMVSIALLEGVLAYELGQAGRGKSAFLRAIAVAPDAKLPWRVSPKVAAALEQARKELGGSSAPPHDPTSGDAPRKVDEPARAMPGPAETGRARAPSSPSSSTPTATEVAGGDLSRFRLPVAIGGGVVAAGGLLAWGRAKSLEHKVRGADPEITTRKALDDTLNQGRTFEKVGWVLVGVGAATAVGSLLLMDGPVEGTTAAITPTSEGAQLSVSWSLP
jgi:hypothetical protein